MKFADFSKVRDEFQTAFADSIWCEAACREGREWDDDTPGYQDAMTKRNLHWKAPHSIPAAVAADLVEFDYRDDDSKGAGKGDADPFVFLAAHSMVDCFEVTLAREYSFCFYLSTPGGFPSDVANELLLELCAALDANEIDVTPDGDSIRVWWD